MATKVMLYSYCKFCAENTLKRNKKAWVLPSSQRVVHIFLVQPHFNPLAKLSDRKFLPPFSHNLVKFERVYQRFLPVIHGVSAPSVPAVIRCFSISKNQEEDLEDIRTLLHSQLSRDKNISEDAFQKQMSILGVLLQNRTHEVSAKTLRDVISSSSPSELYSLATRIFQLQSKVGDEACMVATPLFREAALAGDKNAKYSYGQLVFRGIGGLDADPIEAAVMFTELAKEGHPYAQFTLAGMHYAGYGVEQSFETSYTLFQVAAENGVVQSFNSIGKMYLNGDGVKKDEQKAIEYFMKGAEKGEPQACMSVAHCYSSGKGVEVDYNKAFFYHQKAADTGYTSAIYNVGTHYFAGKGVGLDMVKAAELFQIAADQGFSLAQVNLGNMYYQGLGVEKNIEKAKELYKKAAPNNHNARLILEEIELEEQRKKDGLDQ